MIELCVVVQVVLFFVEFIPDEYPFDTSWGNYVRAKENVEVIMLKKRSNYVRAKENVVFIKKYLEYCVSQYQIKSRVRKAKPKDPTQANVLDNLGYLLSILVRRSSWQAPRNCESIIPAESHLFP